MLKRGVFFSGLLTLCAVSNAQVAWDENQHGDLSDSHLAPTTLNLVLGGNEVHGLTGNPGTGVDRDYFTFIVPENRTLSSITLLDTTIVSGSVSFIALEAGPQVTFDPDGGGVPDFLGFLHYGPEHVGQNLLTYLLFSGNSLAAGQYSIWIQETGGPVNYDLDLELSAVPLPAGAWLLLSGVAGLLAWRRRTSASPTL